VESEKRINLYDITRHYHVINSKTGALSRRHKCKGCNKGCVCVVTHRCQVTCSDCMSVPPCPYDDVRIPCVSCNRQFRSRACFDRHKKNKIGKKTVCEKKRNCAIRNKLITNKGTNISNHSVGLSAEQRDWAFLFYATVKERIGP
jgi:hypothetical protein